MAARGRRTPGPGAPRPRRAPGQPPPDNDAAPAPIEIESPSPAPVPTPEDSSGGAPAPSPSPAPPPQGAAPEGPAPPASIPQTGQAVTPGRRPGTAGSEISRAARHGVRVGPFDPRQRLDAPGVESVLQSLLTGGTQKSITAAQSPVPPSLGFRPRQFEDDQRLLGVISALQGS